MTGPLDVLKKVYEVSGALLKLEGTLNSLRGADTEQKQAIQECLTHFKVLLAVVEQQEKRLENLERTILSVRLGEATGRSVVIDADVAPRHILPPQPIQGKKPKRPPKGP